MNENRGSEISNVIKIGITGSEKLVVIAPGEFSPRRTCGVVLRKGRMLTPQAKRFITLLLEGAEPRQKTNGAPN